ncbi:MAG: bifunctional phosphopantothenoylcysteine decarboxylase/phosphopantothenate--cysteine ligase CoaBC [Pyrinomonadaceae bacterium]
MSDDSIRNSFAGKKVAMGISGGIAAYKAAEVLRGLQRVGCSVRVAMSKHACEFIQPLTFRALSGAHVVVDDYAADNPDPIAHITFSQTVDIFVVVPATANIIAKFANGIADDFLTSTYLAATVPILIVPAMNPSMWSHPATMRNLRQLREDGVHIVDPDEGEMACGTIGPGRLSEPERIVAAALKVLTQAEKRNVQDLAGERLLITTGATREELDPVRFISNRSSGRMGFAVAEAARARGAEVTVVTGVTTVDAPAGIHLVRATSAEEMYAAVMGELPRTSIFIGAAAVADYRPAQRSASKIKKTHSALVVNLERTRDILSEVALADRDGLLVIGFAAETHDLLNNAREKLRSKNVDMIIANDVARSDSGFDSTMNTITILTRGREMPVQLELMSKLDAAYRILDEVVNLRATVTSNALSVPAQRNKA